MALGKSRPLTTQDAAFSIFNFGVQEASRRARLTLVIHVGKRSRNVHPVVKSLETSYVCVLPCFRDVGDFPLLLSCYVLPPPPCLGCSLRAPCPVFILRCSKSCSLHHFLPVRSCPLRQGRMV